jgi:hypothetical protein
VRWSAGAGGGWVGNLEYAEKAPLLDGRGALVRIGSKLCCGRQFLPPTTELRDVGGRRLVARELAPYRFSIAPHRRPPVACVG